MWTLTCLAERGSPSSLWDGPLHDDEPGGPQEQLLSKTDHAEEGAGGVHSAGLRRVIQHVEGEVRERRMRAGKERYGV